MLEVLTLPFMQRAIAASVITGVSFPLVGVFILGLNIVPARFAVMHTALLGAAVGLLIHVDPLIPALVLSVLVGLALGRLARTGVDLSGYIGLFMVVTLALAFLVFYKSGIQAFSAFSFLWGSVLALSDTDLLVALVVGLAILATYHLLHKETQLVLFNQELAVASSVPVGLVYNVLLVCVCLAIASAIRITGALFVDAVTLLPALAAVRLGSNLARIGFLASLFGLAGNLTGLAAAYWFDLPVSTAVILVTSALVLSVMLFRRRT